MRRFLISRGEDHLTLISPQERNRMATGCSLFALAFASSFTLGALAMIEEFKPTNTRIATDLSFFDPAQNHFAFLWLISVLLLIGLIPSYVLMSRRARITFDFDRLSGLVSRDGQIICRLDRIEFVEIRRTFDPDEQPSYRLTVVHTDGHELPIDEYYYEEEIEELAREIARIAEKRIAWKGFDLKIPI